MGLDGRLRDLQHRRDVRVAVAFDRQTRDGQLARREAAVGEVGDAGGGCACAGDRPAAGKLEQGVQPAQGKRAISRGEGGICFPQEPYDPGNSPLDPQHGQQRLARAKVEDRGAGALRQSPPDGLRRSRRREQLALHTLHGRGIDAAGAGGG
jgi:hypothetical protein